MNDIQLKVALYRKIAELETVKAGYEGRQAGALFVIHERIYDRSCQPRLLSLAASQPSFALNDSAYELAKIEDRIVLLKKAIHAL